MVETTYQMLEVLLLHVRLGDGLTSFIENNSGNFSLSFSTRNLKVQIEAPLLFDNMKADKELTIIRIPLLFKSVKK